MFEYLNVGCLNIIYIYSFEPINRTRLVFAVILQQTRANNTPIKRIIVTFHLKIASLRNSTRICLVSTS